MNINKEMYSNSMKSLVILLLLFTMIMPVYAQTSILYCTSNTTQIQNITLSTTINDGSSNTTTITSTTETQRCPFGCDNSTGGINQCNPDPTEPSLFVIVPTLVFFFTSFLLLYIGINMKEGKTLQFMFLGMALFIMIANLWYASNQAIATINTNTGNVLNTVYFAIIVLTIFVIFYYIITLLYDEFKKIQSTKYQTDYK